MVTAPKVASEYRTRLIGLLSPLSLEVISCLSIKCFALRVKNLKEIFGY
jgi:hypothetical protein